MVAVITPIISIPPHRQYFVQRDMSRLTGSDFSHSRCRGCHPCSLPAASLVASNKPYYTSYDRSPTVADAPPKLGRHVPRLIALIILPANAGATLTLSPLLFLQQYFDGLQGTLPHAVPHRGLPCHGNPGHVVTHRSRCLAVILVTYGL